MVSGGYPLHRVIISLHQHRAILTVLQNPAYGIQHCSVIEVLGVGSCISSWVCDIPTEVELLSLLHRDFRTDPEELGRGFEETNGVQAFWSRFHDLDDLEVVNNGLREIAKGCRDFLTLLL